MTDSPSRALQAGKKAPMRISRARLVRVLWIFVILIISLSPAGCDSCTDDMPEGVIEKSMRERAEKITYDPEANQELTLAEGQILLVRLRFGTALADVPNGSYKVRIENRRNNWYDEVEHFGSLGLGGAETSKFNDFIFNATNFNVQMTKPEYYDPKDVDGDYILTLSNSLGWEMQKRLIWENGAFYNGGTRLYEVP